MSSMRGASPSPSRGPRAWVEKCNGDHVDSLEVRAQGASLEDEETPREASYGYRQGRRYENDKDPKEDSS
jgi:hypothetical protein